jgi:hypothetical protein
MTMRTILAVSSVIDTSLVPPELFIFRTLRKLHHATLAIRYYIPRKEVDISCKLTLPLMTICV